MRHGTRPRPASNGMNEHEFESLVGRIGLSPVPEAFRERMQNVALIIEDEPSPELLASMGIPPGDTLLGLYQGVPHTERGEAYGMFGQLPDKITLYRLPIMRAAEEDGISVEEVIAETLWHEVGHHFGLDETEIEARTFKGWKPPETSH